MSTTLTTEAVVQIADPGVLARTVHDPLLRCAISALATNRHGPLTASGLPSPERVDTVTGLRTPRTIGWIGATEILSLRRMRATVAVAVTDACLEECVAARKTHVPTAETARSTPLDKRQ